MNHRRGLTVIHKSTETSWVRGPGVAGLLDYLKLPRQFDPIAHCWMTPRRTVGKLVDYAQANGWRLQIGDERQMTLDEVAS